MGNRLKIAAIPMDCTPAPVSQRLERAAALIAQAAGEGAQLAVLPELFNTGYEFHERNYALAEPIDGETVTWMKTQAAQHNLHLAGTLPLRDKTDVYNAALLIAPDGRTWRYDKRYGAFWERAYFRNGDHITVADTDLGKLGMMICWDQYHPSLWAEYAGHVDTMVIMSCPGDIGSGDLVFLDGFRAKFACIAPPDLSDNPAEVEDDSTTGDIDVIQQQVAWLGIPVVESSATGTIRTRLPLIETIFPTTPLADRTAQAPDAILECGFPPATRVMDSNGEIVAQGTVTGDRFVLAEVELPNTTPKPDAIQPKMNISEAMYRLTEEIVPAMMVPLYKAGLRNQWGSHMAPD